MRRLSWIKKSKELSVLLIVDHHNDTGIVLGLSLLSGILFWNSFLLIWNYSLGIPGYVE